MSRRSEIPKYLSKGVLIKTIPMLHTAVETFAEKEGITVQEAYCKLVFEGLKREGNGEVKVLLEMAEKRMVEGKK